MQAPDAYDSPAAKIVLTRDGKVLQEVALIKERVTIGRRSHNDIVLDHIGISAEHAVITTIDGDSCVEDLNSTNGTQVNGQPVRMHYLRHGDVIKLSVYRLNYVQIENKI
jgi:pSer/pThr/pTyr-binding forkhead associated (FHA) protein